MRMREKGITQAMTTFNDTVAAAQANPDLEQPYASLGLKDDEYARIKEILGRRPTTRNWPCIPSCGPSIVRTNLRKYTCGISEKP